MSCFRVNKRNNYTTMSNYHLKDKTLSLKAVGLLSKMLSLPDNWNYSINGLVAICKEKKTSVISTLDELKEHGYVIVTKKMPNETDTGRIEYIYDIYETPQFEKQGIEKQGIENLGLEFLGLEFQGLENQPQLNTNKSNTKELNTKELSTKEYIKKETCKEKNTKRFVKPSIEEIKEYVFDNSLNVDCEYFYDYYESNGWTVGKNHMKDWKATLRNWSRRNQKSTVKKKSQIEEILEIGEMLDEQERSEQGSSHN